MRTIINFLKKLRDTKTFEIFEMKVFSWLAWFILQTLPRTINLKIINFETVKKLKTEGKNVIYTFWHGEQFILIFNHRHTNLVIMTSLSRDGELQTNIVTKLGYDTVRGSTKKGYTSGIIAMFEKLKNGQDLSFAVDGPKGPAFKVKPGAIFVAQKTGSAIIPVRVVIKNKIQFNNWDKYILPLPFTKAFIFYGEPMFVSEKDSIKDKCYELEKILNDTVEKNMTKTNINVGDGLE